MLPAAEAVGMVFSVAYVTAVRNLVDGDRITEANGNLYASYAVAGIAGPLLAGLVSGWFGPAAAVAVDAASFALSATGLWLIRLRAGGPRPATPERPLAQLSIGARFLWRNPVLRSLTILLSFFILLTMGLPDVLIYYVNHTLHRPAGTVGAVLGVAALGTVAGALLAAPLRRRLGFGYTWIVSTGLGGLAVAAVGLSPLIPVVAGLAAVYQCGNAIGGTCSMSLRQQVTPDHLLGRVTAAFWTIHMSLGPPGTAALTWAAGRYGVPAVCLVAGAGCVLITVVALFTPIRQPYPERLAGG